MSPTVTPKPKVTVTQNFACGLVLRLLKFFRENGFEKNEVIFAMTSRQFKFCTLVCFLILNLKIPKSSYLRHKNVL